MSDHPDTIPELWPPADPFEPVRARRVHWLLVLPVTIPAMIAPRRLGPHLAASSFASAYAAHALSVILFFGWVMAFAAEEGFAHLGTAHTLSEHVRRPFAALVLVLFSTLNNWVDFGALLTGVVVVEIGIWAAALLLLPLCAAGETRGRLYLRCVKLVLWSSMCLLPFGFTLPWVISGFERRPHLDGEYLAVAILIVVAAAWILVVPAYFLYARGEKRRRQFADALAYPILGTGAAFLLAAVAALSPVDPEENLAAVLVGAWLLWIASVLVRLGGRYSGPKIGPTWQMRTPRCEMCGYALTGLPVTARCPECGRLLAESLPQHRKPPAFAVAHGPLGTLRAFVRTTWAALFTRQFARGVVTLRGRRAARNYAFLMCLLVGIISAGLFGRFVLRDAHLQYGPSHITLLLMVALIGGSLALAWLLVAGLFVNGFGFKHAAQRSVVLCYSTAWLLVPLLLGGAGVWTIDYIHREFRPRGTFEIPGISLIEKELFIGAWIMLPATAALILSFFRLRYMLRGIRYANA